MMKGNLYIFIAIIIAGLLIGGAILLTLSPQEKISSSLASLITSGNDSDGSLNENRADYPTLGNPAAPVTMTVFSDFQCHFCKKFAMEIKPAIIEKYVKIGKVKMIFRDFAFLSKESNWAAEAAHCADEQGKYWEYLEKLHLVQEGHDALAFSRDNLKNLATGLGLNMNQFNQCFDSSRYASKVKNSFEQGLKIGVKGTPAVFINNQLIDGVQSLNIYEEAIERELN